MVISGLVLPCSPPAGPGSLDRQPCPSARASKVVLGVSCNGTQCTIATETKQRSRRCGCFDLYKELVPYKEAWTWQKSVVKRRHALMDRGEDHSDTLIVLQHPPVYTLGTGSHEEYLKFDMKDAPYDVYRTERGGEVTYHGPGQLQKSLEEVIIRVLSTTFSIKASRLEGLTGVWVGNQKIAAIGIRVSRWLTYHGLALNIATDLTPFRYIIPCGIQDREVGSLRELLGQATYAKETGETLLMDAAHESMLKEFCEVFQLSLEPVSISGSDFSKEISAELLARADLVSGI